MQTLTRAQLASKYSVHVSTLARWIKKYGIDIPKWQKVLRPADLKKIVEVIGEYE